MNPPGRCVFRVAQQCEMGAAESELKVPAGQRTHVHSDPARPVPDPQQGQREVAASQKMGRLDCVDLRAHRKSLQGKRKSLEVQGMLERLLRCSRWLGLMRCRAPPSPGSDSIIAGLRLAEFAVWGLASTILSSREVTRLHLVTSRGLRLCRNARLHLVTSRGLRLCRSFCRPGWGVASTIADRGYTFSDRRAQAPGIRPRNQQRAPGSRPRTLIRGPPLHFL